MTPAPLYVIDASVVVKWVLTEPGWQQAWTLKQAAAHRDIVLLAINHENACRYCMASQSTVSARAGMPAATLEALRCGKPLADPRRQAIGQSLEERFTFLMRQLNIDGTAAAVQKFVQVPQLAIDREAEVVAAGGKITAAEKKAEGLAD